jgi:hypothetical protein
MLMLHHVDAFAAKADAFHFQAGALFQASLEFQFDFAAGAHYPLPWQRTAGATQ